MTYCTSSCAFRYCRDIFSGSTAFPSSGTGWPNSDDVDAWLADGFSRIQTALASRGYSGSVASSASCFRQVAELEAVYAAAQVHSARNLTRSSPEQWTKGEVLMDRFKKGLADLLTMDLSQAGLSHSSAIYAGGISDSDKEDVEDDTDRVTPRFERGMHDIPGVWYDSTHDTGDNG